MSEGEGLSYISALPVGTKAGLLDFLLAIVGAGPTVSGMDSTYVTDDQVESPEEKRDSPVEALIFWGPEPRPESSKGSLSWTPPSAGTPVSVCRLRIVLPTTLLLLAIALAATKSSVVFDSSILFMCIAISF